MGSYNPFYPFNLPNIPVDTGLIVPDPAVLPTLKAAQEAMPGIKNPYLKNDPQNFARFDTGLQFFVNFPFGYALSDLNWFSADGIPLTTFDDFGRVAPYPLMRVAAVDNKTKKVLVTVDTVAPISGEADCKNCHTSNDPSNGDVGAPTYPNPNAQGMNQPINPIGLSGGAVGTAFNDPQYGNLPLAVSVEYAQDINILRFHDRSNGTKYVDSAGNPTPAPSIPLIPLAPTTPNGDANCLSNRALVQHKPVVCQVCHYTPALDLAQVGPLGGSASYADEGKANCPLNPNPVNCVANGRTQRNKPTMSRVIHRNAHSVSGRFNAFNMPLPSDQTSRNTKVTVTTDSTGLVTGGQCVYTPATATTPATLGIPAANYAKYECSKCAAEGKTVAECAVQSTCYQCHPGKYTKCLRGAMGAAGIFCQDCHGSMAQVGNDFSGNLSIATPFPNGADLTKRIPWANEPGCQSCHVGDAVNQPADKTGFIYDSEGIRLLQAWSQVTYPDGSTAAQPIASPNSRFAEDQTPLEHGQTTPTKRILFRLSKGQRLVTTDTTGDRAFTGHNGVFCEGCHGSTHAEWPVTPAPSDGTWPPPNGTFAANDNVTAGQLQGHTGKIIECATCHTGDFALQNGLGGPHGIHPVGGSVGGPAPVGAACYSQWWVNNHGLYLGGRISETTFLSNCGVCHGNVAANARGTGTGSPLAEMVQTRTLQFFGGLKTLNAGHAVICGDCHGGVPLQ